MAGRGEEYQGVWGWIRLITVPAIYGIALMIFVIRFAPKSITLVAEGRSIGYSLEKAGQYMIEPYVKMINTGQLDVSSLMMPIIGGIVVSFAYILYHKDI